jgi:hypothetical protein
MVPPIQERGIIQHPVLSVNCTRACFYRSQIWHALRFIHRSVFARRKEQMVYHQCDALVNDQS